jgi:hypothetical protein
MRDSPLARHGGGPPTAARRTGRAPHETTGMRFYINPDASEAITGWLTPDDYRARPKVRIVLDGWYETVMECTIPYPPLKEWNWHETGVCGFAINETTLPGSFAAERIEVFDPWTNVLLYRRVNGQETLDRKLLLVTTGAEPEHALQNLLFTRFQTAYFTIEDMPEETLANLMAYAKIVGSMVLAGNILVPRYENFCAQNQIDAALLIRDPWETLAGRLHRLRRAAPLLTTEGQEWRVAHMREAVAFAGSFDPQDRRGARRLLRDLPEAAYHQLANPLTRQLGTKQSGGTVEAEHAAVAIEVLSRVQVVGHAAHYDAFIATLFDHLGVEAPPVEPDLPSPDVLATAEALREDGAAEFLVTHDLRLSEAVSDIIGKQWVA